MKNNNSVIRLNQLELERIEDYRKYKLIILQDLIEAGFSSCEPDYQEMLELPPREILSKMISDAVYTLKKEVEALPKE